METITISSSVQSRLKELRKTLDKTQQEIAEALGITKSAYCMIEKDATPLQERHILLLEKAFKINRIWLLTGNGNMFNKQPTIADEYIRLFEKLSPYAQEFALHNLNFLLEHELKPSVDFSSLLEKINVEKEALKARQLN